MKHHNGHQEHFENRSFDKITRSLWFIFLVHSVRIDTDDLVITLFVTAALLFIVDRGNPKYPSPTFHGPHAALRSSRWWINESTSTALHSAGSIHCNSFTCLIGATVPARRTIIARWKLLDRSQTSRPHACSLTCVEAQPISRLTALGIT